MQVVPHRDAQGRFAAMPAGRGRDGIRGKDRKKYANWNDLEVVHQFDDGIFIGNVTDPADLKLLSRFGGGCSGDHVWNISNGYEFIMAVFDKDAVAHNVMHMLGLHVAWCNIKPDPNERVVYSNYTYSGSLTDSRGGTTWKKGQHNHTAEPTIERMELEVEWVRQYLEDTQREYDHAKQQALTCGVPMGNGNPHKHTMDYYNRHKGVYLQQIAEWERKIAAAKELAVAGADKVLVCKGATGQAKIINGTPVKIITGGTHNEWAEYASDWLDTCPDAFTQPIKHRLLKKPVVCNSISELKDAVIATGHEEVKWLIAKKRTDIDW